MKPLIWGAGAIGGTVGAYLARSGLEVTFVDADRAHVEAMREKGLELQGPIDAFTVRVTALHPDEGRLGSGRDMDEQELCAGAPCNEAGETRGVSCGRGVVDTAADLPVVVGHELTASPESAILSAVIFNAIVIVLLVPLALRGVKYRAASAASLLRRNLLIYGLGGVIAPFLGIWLIDLLIRHLPGIA